MDGTIVKEYRPVDRARKWAELAHGDGDVDKVLNLFGGDELDWVNLSRIYEILANDAGGLDVIDDKGWASKTSIKLFKNTANNPQAV